jgi:hypothetical protein
VWTTNAGPSIRVYCTDESGVSTEWCSDPGKDWYKGTYTPA